MTDMTIIAPPAGSIPAGVLADAGAATAAFLRLGDAGADRGETVLVQRLAAVAFGMAEAFLGQALVLHGFEDVVVADGGWRRLAREPARTIAGVTALPAGAAPLVLPVEAYRIDIDDDGRGWVRVTGDGPLIDSGGPPLVAVAYTAGLAADWAALPAPIAQGVVALAASLFADRGSGVALPPGVAALWRPFRRLHLATPPHGDRP